MKDYIRLLKYLRKYKKRFFVGVLCSILASVLNVFSLGALMPIFQTMMADDKQAPFQIDLNHEDLHILHKVGDTNRVLAFYNKIKFTGYKIDYIKNLNKDEIQSSLSLSFIQKYRLLRAEIKLRFNEFSADYTAFKFLTIVCWLFLPIYLLKLLATLGSVYYIVSSCLLAIKDIRNELYGHLVDLPLSYFVREKTGNLMSRIINDVIVISDSFSDRLRVSITSFFIVVTHVAFLAVINLELVGICLIGVPLILWPVSHYSRKIKNISTGEQTSLSLLNAHLQELISGIRVVRAFGMENYEKKKFNELNETMLHQTLKYRFNYVLGPSLVEIVTFLIIIGLLIYGASKILDSQMSMGSFFTFIFTLVIALTPIKQIANWFNDVGRTSAAGARIFEIIDYKLNIEVPKEPKILGKLSHSIEFKNVSFQYPNTNKPVLNNINITAPIGSTIALVGHSGAGKSTLVDLIPRFYDTTGGTISFDGVDIKDLSLEGLRSKIGVVTQDVFLFHGTVRENICFGREDISEEDMLRAAQLAYADEFIQKLPQKYDSLIGERGLVLSGGQRQRLSIARALLKNPELLILDEATSALDTTSEKLVQQALKYLMNNRTTFVIAHRLSTIYEADEIIVLDKGEIIERGSHKDLLEKEGAYKKLYDMQFSDVS